jgi:hypothetical protein
MVNDAAIKRKLSVWLRYLTGLFVPVVFPLVLLKRREAHASHSQNISAAKTRSRATIGSGVSGPALDGGESERQTIAHDKLPRVR